MRDSSLKEALLGGIGVAGTLGAVLLAPLWVALFMAAVVALVVVTYTSQKRVRFVGVAIATTSILAGVVAFTNASDGSGPAHENPDQLGQLAEQIEGLIRERDKAALARRESESDSSLVEEIPILDLGPLRLATAEYINRLRDHHGLPPVEKSLVLDRIAQRNVRRMIGANELSHAPGGQTFLGALPSGFDSFSQLVGGETSGSSWTSVIAAWMRSRIYRQTLLWPQATDIGIGAELNASRPFKHLWTVVLARRDDSMYP